jgi:broad specificity phosphatase PhoE
MTTFYLIRHGEANYELAEERNLVGSTREFVPLTNRGVGQVERLSYQLREHQAELILSSPLTRAMQTAAILSRELDLPMKVEFDLREWIPDFTNTYEGSDAVLMAYTELLEAGGEWPEDVKKKWEPLSSVRQRVTDTLIRYTNCNRVFVVCHGAVITSLVGHPVDLAHYFTFDLDGKALS